MAVRIVILRKENFACEELWYGLIMNDFAESNEKGMVEAEEVHLKVIEAELDPVFSF